MGFPKACLRIDGNTLLARAAGTLVAGGCDRAIAVVSDPEVARAVEGSAVVVWNHDRETGMLGSLRCALATMAPDDSVVFVPVDQPGIGPAVVGNLLRFLDRDAVVRPIHSGRHGHPVAFGPDVATQLRADDMRDCRLDDALRRCAGRMVDVPVEDAEILVDLDTPGAWREWTSQHRVGEAT